MRERGIIFNADMVRAVLSGSKTQTRRIIVPSMRSADAQFELHQQSDGSWRPMHTFNEGSFDSKGCERPINCPFGAVGDHLWVRETWMPDAPRDGTWGDVEFYGCKGSPLSMIPKRYRTPEHCIHRASWDGHEMVGWTPSIHMPRWASRITLEITGVRVERLQDISGADACAEGIREGIRRTDDSEENEPVYCNYLATNLNDPSEWFDRPSDSFISLWESIYGAESWQHSPWVWVIEFKRVESE